MKYFLIMSVFLLLTCPLPAGDNAPVVIKKDGVHTWENVGEITSVSGKTFTLRQVLRLSEATWSLLPGAVSSASQLQPQARIHAKGSTLADGIYDTRRIFLISQGTPRPSAGSLPQAPAGFS